MLMLMLYKVQSFSRERKKKQFSLLLTKTNVKNTWRETEKKWMESVAACAAHNRRKDHSHTCQIKHNNHESS